jgi:signal transduction histidine kinase
MTARFASPATRRLVLVLAIGVCASVALLAAFAFQAVREWEHTATLLAERHAQEGADLLALALTRDMRGAQETVLSSQDLSDSMPDGSFEASDEIASTFARFPYPELFFAWSGSGPASAVRFFLRSDRVPSWMGHLSTHERFPVLVETAPDAARPLVARVLRDVEERRRFSIFDIQIGDTAYQVVARLHYRDPFREEPLLVFGFLVNLRWVRENYFPQVARQVARIVSEESDLVFSMHPTRESGDTAAGPMPRGHRVVPMMFFDPFLVAADPPADLTVENWTLQALLADDAALESARAGAGQTLMVVALGGTGFALGLALTLYSTWSSAKLAQLRADFVATVTHELKTPIATIRAAGDTLASGRLSDEAAARRYAQLMVDESKHLTRLLDNLLAYARIADTTEVYSFRPVDVSAIVEQSLRSARWRLDRGGFDVTVDIPPELPPVHVDWTAICLVLDNLVDNAVRYSKEHRALSIRAAHENDTVRIDVTDRGIGIPAAEIRHVTERFFRGRGAASGGSGLGLAIVERIVKDHRGSLSIESSVGSGSVVSIILPVSRVAA